MICVNARAVIFALLLSYDGPANGQELKYDLERPNAQYRLPAILNEVSGLTDIDDSHIACVQDELGIVFVYNFKSGKVVVQQKFSGPGDFEGLTYTGDALYILRSDGRLTEWSGFKAGTNKGRIAHHKLNLITNNNEGLCYDKTNRRLLISAKNKPYEKTDKNKRYIYAFDLRRKELQRTPVYTVDVVKLYSKAKELNITTGNETRRFNFRPASLSIHPKNGLIYVISAVDKLLVGINEKSEVVYMKRLNPAVFPKAEGITFLDDETMIIVNEAAGKVATLYVYKKRT